MLLGQLDTVAFASEGHLIFPSHVNEPVELNLADLNLNGDEAEYADLLQVYVGKSDTCCSNRTPIAGQYEEVGGFLKFVPTYEFVEGQDYVVSVWQLDAKDVPYHTLAEFNIKSDAPVTPTYVTDIYPSGELLPENVLRFYIHFSKPMKPHVAFNYIKLIDATGNVDDAAFMQFKQELWSEDRKRLTLLMGPGRIKRDVSTNLRLGPALRKDQQYTLLVEAGWTAANGDQPLARYEKSFRVTDALRQLPAVNLWEITAPALGGNSALTIRFDRPFDHQLLQTDIKLVTESGLNIPGSIEIGNHETEWNFKPDDNWADERIHIVVDSELEDVAGNNFKDLLDHSIDTKTKKIRSTSIAVDLRS